MNMDIKQIVQENNENFVKSLSCIFELQREYDSWLNSISQKIENLKNGSNVKNKETQNKSQKKFEIAKEELIQVKKEKLENDTENTRKSKRTKRKSSNEHLIQVKKEQINKNSDGHKKNETDNRTEMPPPTMPVLRKGRPKKIKSENDSTVKKSTKTLLLPSKISDIRCSDVILQKEEIPLIDLLDTTINNVDLKKTESKSNKSTESTRSESFRRSKRNVNPKNYAEDTNNSTLEEEVIRKTESVGKSNKNVDKKRNYSTSSDEGCKTIQQNKKKKSESSSSDVVINDSMYENEKSLGNKKSNTNQLNSTCIIEKPFICEKKMLNESVVLDKKLDNQITNLDSGSLQNENRNILNETHVLSSHKDEVSKKNQNHDDIVSEDEFFGPEHKNDLLTEDESDDSPTKTTMQTVDKNTLIFTPIERNPVKNRVKAVEKMVTESKAQSLKRNKPVKEKHHLMKSNSLNIKCTTPMSATKLPILKAKYGSTTKSGRKEDQESELMRQKMALIQEKKQKREEKHLKAQLLREEEEKKKQKQRQEQLMKDEEKYLQIKAEKKEKLRKQKEEADRKRLLALKKSQEERAKEERKKAEEYQKAELQQKTEEKKKAEENMKLASQNVPEKNNENADEILLENKKRLAKKCDKSVPKFLMQEMPLLPTDDCYDSDDPEAHGKRVICPHWNQEKIILKLEIMECFGTKLMNTLYCTKPETPNLVEIFEVIEPKKLKRTSSAVWRKPPRFTILPVDESINDSKVFM